MEIHLQSIATANPSLYVSQSEAYASYARLFNLSPDEDALYRRLLLDGPVRGRYIGMDSTDEAIEKNPDKLNARFLHHARRTAALAARRALSRANTSPDQVGGLAVNTCTGYLCPGLSSYVAGDLGLSKNIRTLDLAGMGCGGAIPNLECVSGLLHIDATRPILSVAVEICSATLFMGPDPGLVVSNAIFGDGAAATLLGGTNDGTCHGGAAKILAFASVLHPEHREQLRYRQEGGRLRNHLSVKVPVIGAQLAGRILDALLTPRQLNPASIRWWAIHAGGTAVLDKVGQKLGLTPDDLRFSLDTFRNYGNMSSPTVMFALEKILLEGRPAKGELGVLIAFGAGFSAFGALIEFTGEL